MTPASITAQLSTGDGFVAALDQSGGSTPVALEAYGLTARSWSSEAEMYQFIHDMRTRIIRAPSFSGEKVLATILFEMTMNGEISGEPVPVFLRRRGIVPILKIDKGLQPEMDGVRLMKPIEELDTLLDRAGHLGVFATKMRSVVKRPSLTGIASIVEQQFAVGDVISTHGFLPILEPEVSIDAPERAKAESLLADEIVKRLDALTGERQVILKLSLPEVPDTYMHLVAHDRVARVLALSGGYSRLQACRELARNPGMIASFSRALVEDLRYDMNDAVFDASLKRAIDQIYEASVKKR